ncbi:MAG: alpha-glucan family phosphorylase [Myxococcota bacterium]|nr:alpha-glucan family phosphorylase [Myxococcota bacterium]
MSQPHEQLARLSQNLWWSWDKEATALLEEIAPSRWSQVNHNPVALLAELTPAERARIEADAALCARIAAAHARMERWLSQREQRPGAKWPSVAYLSMEFGLHESVRIYSGGLGVLAGDHLRSAADLGMDFRGIGLFYKGGYFRQVLDDGRQLAAYPEAHPERLPLEKVRDTSGAPIRLQIPEGSSVYEVEAWCLKVGTASLYLLDADLPENPPHLREVTRSLYGGDTWMRLRQEILLGIGGVRLLEALGDDVEVIHLNEGHCALAPMEAIRQQVLAGVDFEQALRSTRDRTVFTTHTPVPAGHDRFSWDQINSLLGAWRDQAGWGAGTLMDLGRENPSDLSEPLCMTALALRLSRDSNGVSELHGEVSRQMWSHVETERPIGHITNGVHPVFWTGAPMQDALDAELPSWRERWRDTAWWTQNIDRLSDAALLEARAQMKAGLLAQVHAATGQSLDPDALLIGFARRFAPYKRADLIFADLERLEAILQQGATLVFAGKAHPRDGLGQELLARVVRFSRDPRFRGQVAFLPGYEIAQGRAMTSGSDLWLNNPRRPREASGTSGQKVVLNGGLNCSILDGWWPEAYDGKGGFAISDTRDWEDTQAQDAHDAEALYSLLETTVLPAWKQPAAWLQRVRHSMATGVPVFNTHRMVAEYAENIYTARPQKALKRSGS